MVCEKKYLFVELHSVSETRGRLREERKKNGGSMRCTGDEEKMKINEELWAR